MSAARPAPAIDREELRRRCETDLAPRLRALEDDPRSAAAFHALVSGVAGLLIPGARFSEEGSASGAKVDASGLFGERAERCESRAGLVGAVRPAGLVFAEVRLYGVSEWYDASRNRSGRPVSAQYVNRRRETDLFRGLFFGFDLGSTARGTTFLDPRRVGPAIADRDALEPVTLDDPAFERVYRVTSSDPEEARALLLPSSRSGLLRLSEAARRPVHVSISDGRVSVAVEYHDHVFEPGSRAVDFDRVAAMADLFSLVDLAAAALPVGVALTVRGAPASVETPPARPATSRTRLTHRAGGLSVEYTRSASVVSLCASGMGAPILAWFWLLAAIELLGGSGDKTGVMAAMIPLAVGTLLWLYAAQAWWAPVRRVEVEGGDLRVTRGLLRRTCVPAAGVRDLAVRDGVLHADDLPLTPRLRGDELRWLAYELGQALRGGGADVRSRTAS
jgi:Protein of unknown function (DUF3137)